MTGDMAPWTDFIENISPYQKEGSPAKPHQPVLLLVWLRHNLATGSMDLPFAVAEPILRDALPKLSKSSAIAGKGHLPFSAFIKKPTFWSCSHDPDALQRTGSHDLRVGPLKENGVSIRPSAELAEAWHAAGDHAATRLLTETLRAFFPPRIWQHVIDVIGGLRFNVSEVSGAVSLEPFRSTEAWEIRSRLLKAHGACQACPETTLEGALEVVHPRWLTYGGAADSLDNALLLCRTHGTAFDLGRLGVTREGWARRPGTLVTAESSPRDTTSTAWHALHILRDPQ